MNLIKSMFFSNHLTTLLCLIIIFSGGSIINAQKDIDVITFEKGSRSSSYKTRSSTESYLVIKSNAFSFIFGKQYLETELKLADYLAIEGGIGVTFMPPIGGLGYTGIFIPLTDKNFCTSPNFSDSNNYCDYDSYSDYSIRKSSLGPLLSTSLKFYTQNDALDGGYLALNVRYTRRNLSVLKIIQQYEFERSKTDYATEKINTFDYSVRLGYQNIINPMTTEIFIGIGIRSVYANRLDIGFDESVSAYANKFQSFSDQSLFLEGGLKIGFSFFKPKETSKKSAFKKKRRRK